MRTPGWAAARSALDDADSEANPVGTVRKMAVDSRMSGAIWLAGLPGLWKVRSAKLESGVWMHELERFA